MSLETIENQLELILKMTRTLFTSDCELTIIARLPEHPDAYLIVGDSSNSDLIKTLKQDMVKDDEKCSK